jgi:hypothetical protein
MAEQAKSTYRISDLWMRQQDLNISMPVKSPSSFVNPTLLLSSSTDDLVIGKGCDHPSQHPVNLRLGDLPVGLAPPTISEKEHRIQMRKVALNDISELLRKKTARIAKFGPEGLYGHLLKRYEMVHAFLLIQQKNSSTQRQVLALQIAHAFGRGSYTTRAIVQWERSWVAQSYIPAGQHGKAGSKRRWAMESLFEDEGLHLAIREYASGVKDG